MSYKITRRVWALRNIPTTHKVVLLALADFARDNAECFPHIATIMEHTGQSRPTVFRALAWLEENGHILRKNRSAEGKGSIYTILAPALAQERAQYETPAYQTDTPPVSDRYPSAPPPIVEDLTNNLTVPAPDKLEREARAPRAPAPAQEPAFELQSKPQRKARKGSEPAARPHDVTEGTWADFVEHRKRKRASITAGVIESARALAEEWGWSLEKYLKAWVLHGTQGFHPSWVERKQNGAQNGGGYISAAQQAREERKEWVRKIFEPFTKEQNDAATVDAVKTTRRDSQLQLLECEK